MWIFNSSERELKVGSYKDITKIFLDPIGNLLLVTNKLKLSAVTIPLLLALGLHALMKFKKLLQLEPVATAMIRNGVRWENGPIWKPRVSFGNLVFYVKPYIFAVYGRSRYIYIYITTLIADVITMIHHKIWIL